MEEEKTRDKGCRRRVITSGNIAKEEEEDSLHRLLILSVDSKQ